MPVTAALRRPGVFAYFAPRSIALRNWYQADLRLARCTRQATCPTSAVTSRTTFPALSNPYTRNRAPWRLMRPAGSLNPPVGVVDSPGASGPMTYWSGEFPSLAIPSPG